MRRFAANPFGLPTLTAPRAGGLRAMLLAAGLALVAGPLAAQTACGISPGIGAAAGFVHYPPNGGINGLSAGLDAGFDLEPYALRVSYRRLFLEGEAADPDIVRAEAGLAVAEPRPGLRLCATGHAGTTRFDFDGDTGYVVAAGLGARLVPMAEGPIQPFFGVRGLGARAVGTVLGLSIDAAGLSLGAEAGATLALGPLNFRVVGTIDGFDDGLGVTPYPGYSAELALDYRF